MHEFMVTIRFSSEIDEEFMALIPAHRALVNQLMSRGVITSYSLALDRQTLWLTLMAGSEVGVKTTLEMMPLYKYMVYEAEQLMFHNSPVFAPQRLSMN